jgi:hypothetical protein
MIPCTLSEISQPQARHALRSQPVAAQPLHKHHSCLWTPSSCHRPLAHPTSPLSSYTRAHTFDCTTTHCHSKHLHSTLALPSQKLSTLEQVTAPRSCCRTAALPAHAATLSLREGGSGVRTLPPAYLSLRLQALRRKGSPTVVLRTLVVHTIAQLEHSRRNFVRVGRGGKASLEVLLAAAGNTCRH